MECEDLQPHSVSLDGAYHPLPTALIVLFCVHKPAFLSAVRMDQTDHHRGNCLPLGDLLVVCSLLSWTQTFWPMQESWLFCGVCVWRVGPGEIKRKACQSLQIFFKHLLV